MVKGTASPDDPTLAEYWAERRRKTTPLPAGKTSLELLEAQHGRCPLCGGSLLLTDDPPQSPHEWERWLAGARTAIIKTAPRADGTSDEPRLTHIRCLRRHITGRSTDPQHLHAREPRGLLEPCATKAARTVLRGAGRSNASGLHGGLRLEPRLPLGLQRARDSCLMAAIENHGDTEWPAVAARWLGDVHASDREGPERLG